MYIALQTYYDKTKSTKNESGFSITDVMIASAVVAILATLATPNLKMLMKGYKLRAASNDLVAFVQTAKIRAAKNNETWSINLNPSGYTGYEIKDGLGNIISAINFGICETDSSVFDRCYNGDVQYKHPQSGLDPYDTDILTFSSTGIASEGYVALSNKPDTRYYRIRVLSTSGIVRTERWDGIKWE